MDQDVTTAQAPLAAAPREQSFGARAMAALGFGFVGAKIGMLGLIPDVNAVMGPTNMTFGEKFKGVFNGKLLSLISDKVMADLHGKAATNSQVVWSLLKVTKWSNILTLAGVGAGAIAGWVQGGKIENWKDIFTHPWQSTKILVGLEEPPAHDAAPLPVADAPSNEAKPRRSHVEALQKQAGTASVSAAR